MNKRPFDGTLPPRFASPSRALWGLASLAMLGAVAWSVAATSAPMAYKTLPQGWSQSQRFAFYGQDQGSRIMPLAWMQALRTPEGRPFLADGLQRFGYLTNEQSAQRHLPVGFVAAQDGGVVMVGMTCAACHTRQIEVQGQPYRIDGGPALANFQQFLAALDAGVAYALATPASFEVFAESALDTPTPDPASVATLRAAVDGWYLSFHTLMQGALPNPEWGEGRLDAVSMIFDRLSGLDIGTSPDRVMPDNIKRADAPVRYPFLWNATVQDKTQWPGFADNGNELLGLARNVGEVMGVFATFHPVPDDQRPILGVNYTGGSSFNFEGLKRLETTLRQLQPPPWPGTIDQTLAARGATVFAQTCASCHGVRRGEPRPLLQETWATPVQNVGTDTREWSILARKVDPGVLRGASIPLLKPPLTDAEEPINVLAVAVIGSILDHGRDELLGAAMPEMVRTPDFGRDAMERTRDLLQGAFRNPSRGDASFGSYESRVLRGIWAAAPYLHNGSVPTLADLLKPVAQRPASFGVGPAYDLSAIGLARQQGAGASTMVTTDCDALDSGNSRCGHSGPLFGTALSDADKKALLEYLKTDMR